MSREYQLHQRALIFQLMQIPLFPCLARVNELRYAHTSQLEVALFTVAMITQPSATPYNRRRGSKHDKTGCATCRTRFVFSKLP
jgi:hypothetical protein